MEQQRQLLWGYKDGGKFTSELPAHLMSHMARLSVDKDNRVVIHSHPTNTLAMNYVHELDEEEIYAYTLGNVYRVYSCVPGWCRYSPMDALRN